MKRVKNSVRMIALAVVLCMMLTMGVLAAETGSVWIAETNTDGGTAAVIFTDATVTDGVVTVTYDADALTYQGVATNEVYVAMHAVNADVPGEVAISWVAPGEVAPEGTDWLIQVNFTGESDEDVALEGTVSGGEIINVDKTELEKAVLEAQGLSEELWTAESWAVLEEALADAEAVLADPVASQEEVDAATAALRAAMDALVLAETEKSDVDKSELAKNISIAEGLKKDNYTKESWKSLEAALKEAKAVMDDPDATQEEVDAAAAALKAAIAALELKKAADTGDNADLVMPVVTAVVCVAAIAAVVVVMKKKEGKA